MTDTFETTFADIRSQESNFKDRDERAAKIAAVLPLPRKVGWNTANLSGVYPQLGLSGGGIVDYDLRLDGDSCLVSDEALSP